MYSFRNFSIYSMIEWKWLWIFMHTVCVLASEYGAVLHAFASLSTNESYQMKWYDVYLRLFNILIAQTEFADTINTQM